MPARILVCGNPTIDELVDRRGISMVAGGSALFASGAIAYLGSSVRVLGNVGKDYPKAALGRLKALHIDVQSLTSTKGPSTRFRITRLNGSRSLRLVEPGNPITVPEDRAHYRGVHLGPVFNEVSTRLVRTLRTECEFMSADLQGFIREVSSSGLVRTKRGNLSRLLGQCDVVQASIDEAKSQTRSQDPRSILSRFLRFRVQFAIVTMGKTGSWLGSRRGSFHFIPAYPERSVRDSTGAGDIFGGSWLTTYLSTQDPVWASAVGSAFASLASRRTGLSKFRVSRPELLRRAAWVYRNVKASKLV